MKTTQTLEMPYKPDNKALLFVTASLAASMIGYLLLFSKVNLR